MGITLCIKPSLLLHTFVRRNSHLEIIRVVWGETIIPLMEKRKGSRRGFISFYMPEVNGNLMKGMWRVWKVEGGWDIVYAFGVEIAENYRRWTRFRWCEWPMGSSFVVAFDALFLLKFVFFHFIREKALKIIYINSQIWSGNQWSNDIKAPLGHFSLRNNLLRTYKWSREYGKPLSIISNVQVSKTAKTRKNCDNWRKFAKTGTKCENL